MSAKEDMAASIGKCKYWLDILYSEIVPEPLDKESLFITFKSFETVVQEMRTEKDELLQS
jgi:hypothetical protein